MAMLAAVWWLFAPTPHQALVRAIKRDDIAAVDRWIDRHGINTVLKEPFWHTTRRTALMLEAIDHGSREMVLHVLQRGADPRKRGLYRSALERALLRDDQAILYLVVMMHRERWTQKDFDDDLWAVKDRSVLLLRELGAYTQWLTPSYLEKLEAMRTTEDIAGIAWAKAEVERWRRSRQ
jgi:hypothetical protein